MPKKATDVCPICKGAGKYDVPAKMQVDVVEIKRRLAKELEAKGYSVRQIMVALGYKSPRSIQQLLK